MKTQLLLCATGDHAAMAPAAAARWLSLLPELAGVTIAGGKEADALGIRPPPSDPRPHTHRACALKLHAFDLIPQDCDAVLYADLDVYPFQPMAPSSALAGVDFACVRDRWDDGAVNEVSDPLHLPRHQYFNAGLFYARRAAAPMLAGARWFCGRLKWHDQTGLNLSRFVHRTPTAWLPWHANAMDHHRAGHYMSAAHCPDFAWAAWKDGKHPETVPRTLANEVISGLDLSHGYSTSACHLRELSMLAYGRRHILEVGTFQAAASWTMAATGALVTTLDPAHEKSARLFRHGLSIDAMAHTGEQWLQMDPDGTYDLVFHDAEHGPHIIPELRAWWNRLTPGGILAIHDAEQLAGWQGEDLTPNATITTDERGRQLLVLENA